MRSTGRLGLTLVLKVALVLAAVTWASAAPFAYITNGFDNTVSVIDITTNTVGTPISVGSGPYGVAVTSDGSRVYVGNYYGNTVSVISTATSAVVGAPIPVGLYPIGVAVTPGGSRVYVANYGDNTVSVISTATNPPSVGAPVSVGSSPYGVAVTPDGSRVYVANYGDNTVSVISTATNTVGAPIPAGSNPYGVAVTPDGSSVYVANSGSTNMVSVISTATNTVVATVHVGSNPVAFGKFIGGKPLPDVGTFPHWYQAGIPGVKDTNGFTYPTSSNPLGNFWARDPYDSIPLSPPPTIQQKGCALTTLTMVANFWAGQLNDPTDYSSLGLDPRKMNLWNGIYAPGGKRQPLSFGNVDWNNFASVANTTSPFVRLYQACSPSNPNCAPSPPNNSFTVFADPKDTLDNILRNGVPVILRIFAKNVKSAIHFVVVTGKTPNGDYRVNDPGDVNTTTLNNLQNNNPRPIWLHPGETLDIARSFDAINYIVYVGPDPATGTYKAIVQKDPSTARAVGISSSDPVEFVLTDPQGRRTGFDPVSNTSFQEIPTSAYSSTLYRDDQNLSAPDPPPFKALDIANQLPGQYSINVIGTGSGDFSVAVRASDAAGNWITQTYSGTTAPGVSSQFTFQGGVTTFTAFGANLAISPSHQAFGVDGTLTLGQGGTISPATQPVTVQLGNGFLVTLPAGSFEQTPHGTFVFGGVIQGILLGAALEPTSGNSYAFAMAGAGAPNLPSANPVDVRLAIGSNGGSTSVNANFVP